MTAGTAAGFVACLIASVFFGTMFVPLKRFDCGDGFYVQWVMCVGIFLVGLVVNAVQNFPKFYPLAMLGGALWATGNITSLPIVQTIGMGLGILLWSSSNLLSGWASGRFGWFGLKKQIPNNEALNYAAVVLALISTVMFAFVKNRDPALASDDTGNVVTDDQEPILPRDPSDYEPGSDTAVNDDDGTGIMHPARRERKLFTAGQKRAAAIVVSLIAGLFYGLCFAPVIWIQDNIENASKEGLDYVFAHYCGVLLTSTSYFILYCAVKKNKPVINSAATLPAMLAGLMWAIAQTAFFVANEALMEAVSFPIITRFPGLISAALGVFVYKEIRGRKNLHILALAILVTIIGGVLSGLSFVIK